MITRFGLLKRSPAMSRAQFDAYWRDSHAPLVAGLPGLRAYCQHGIVEKGAHAIAGDWELDGFSQLRFDDAASMRAAFAAASGQRAGHDLSVFLADARVVACETHTVVPARIEGDRVVKRMSLLRRKPGMSDSTFRHEWLELHAEMMRQWPGVSGYNQNVVVDRFHRSATQSASYDEVPVDGIVEIWFPSPEQAAATHATRIVAETMAHAREFLCEITPFLVSTRRIV